MKFIIIIWILPFIFFLALWGSAYRSKLHWFLRFLFILLFTTLIFISPMMYLFPIYLRIAIPIVFLAATILSFLKIRKLPNFSKSDWQEVIIIAITVTILFFLLSYQPKPKDENVTGPSVELSFPLKNGTYVVSASGYIPATLSSHSVHNMGAQKYAVDIIKSRDFSELLKSFFSSGLSSYAIYGDDLYSPCRGIVEKTNGENNGGDLPDLIPPQKDLVNMNGNYLIISCKGVRVFMAHMMKGSIKVKEGQSVTENDIIGKVGNSGNTDGPHLHISAVIQKSDDLKDAEPVKIIFNGRYLGKNDYIESNIN